MTRTFAVPLLLLLASIPARAQDAREQVDVNLVLVDARVTDSAGNQILGLGADDFVVKENGVEQKIESVDYYTNRRLLDSPETRAAFKVERVREGRDLLFFFDKHRFVEGDSLSDLMQAKEAAQRFVDEQLTPGDRVAVLSWDVRLRVFSDFTSDKRALKKALDEVVTFAGGIKSAPRDAAAESLLANLDTRRMIGRSGRITDALKLVADAVAPIPRRKMLFYFTSGMENERIEMDKMIRALSRSNTTVYAISMLRNRRLGDYEDAITKMTSSTGGDYYRDAVNLYTPLQQIDKGNSGYYLLTYRTRRNGDEHGFQKLDVSLRNPEFKVKARPGYAY